MATGELWLRRAAIAEKAAARLADFPDLRARLLKQAQELREVAAKVDNEDEAA
jgi:hypothetical protein